MKKIKRKQNKTYREIVPERINKEGYSVVDLEDDDGNIIEKGVRVDIAVAEAFIRPLKEDETVIHLDHNLTNNRVDNLKIVKKKDFLQMRKIKSKK